MDSIFFAVKRTHLTVLSFTRPLLTEFGLTPARFDLLYALTELYRGTQIELRKALGVARSTLSEMLASLVKIGFIEKERDPKDRRTWLLRLTEKGRDGFRRALETHINSGNISTLVDSIVTNGDVDAREDLIREDLDACLWWIRSAFGEPMRSLFEVDLDFVEGALIDLDDRHGVFLKGYFGMLEED